MIRRKDLFPMRPTSMHRGCVLAAACAAAISATSCKSLTPRDNKAAAHERWSQVRGRFKYQLARQQFDGGLFQEAILNATEAISLDPKEVDAYVVLARANLELGKPATAETTIQAASQAGLVSPELAYTEGVILELRQDPETAASRFSHARELNPRKVEYLVAEVECLVALGRLDDARRILNDCRHQYDDTATVAMLAAHLANLSGDTEIAVDSYRRAWEDARESPSVNRELGLILAKSNRCSEAIPHLRTVVEAWAKGIPDEGAVRRALAACYLDAGSPDAAIDALRDYAAPHPDDALAQVLLAKAALAADDMVTALRAADQAWRSDPHRVEVRLVRATVQFRRGEHDAAAAILYDLLANQPNDIDAMCLLAEVLRARRQNEGARGYFQRALDLNPQCAWAKLGLASLANRPDPPQSAPQPKLTSAGATVETPDAPR